MFVCFSYKRHWLSSDTYALGPIETKKLAAQEALLLSDFHGEEVTTVPSFRRLSRGDEVFFCEQYSRVKRRNSYTVTYENGHKYGQIVYFTLFKNRPAAVIKKLVMLPAIEMFLPTKTIVPV